jgi:hypothetical protein
MKRFVGIALVVAAALALGGAMGDYAGIAVRAVRINADNQGLAIWTPGPVPLNLSGNVPFALSVLGDVAAGDLYCIDQGGPGCVYGRSYGTATGARIYQSNKFINEDAGGGGPGFILWPDVANIDGSGNRGYADIWAWGQNDSAFSNTLNFGNRGADGTPTRRFRILNDGSVQIPGLAGAGTERVCVAGDGSLRRGGC